MIALLAEGLDPARGGAERAVRAVASALARRGEAVSIYAPADRLGPALAGVRLVGVDVPSARPWRDLALARALPRAARADRATSVIACGKVLDADLQWSHGGVHAASRAAATGAGRGRLLGAIAGLARRSRPVEWALDAIEARAAVAAREGGTRIVALSERVARDLAAHHGLRPAAIVRNGVDPARFAPPRDARRLEARAALERRAGAETGAPVALLVAHAPRLKGLDAALRALSRAPDLRLAVAGAFPPRPWLAVARHLGVAERVALLGAVDDPRPLYEGASVLVHPTLYDPCSLVVLEAAACGLPVVTTREDGAGELLDATSGRVLTDPADFAALAHAALELAAPEAGAAARERPLARSWDDVAAELLAARRDARGA